MSAENVPTHRRVPNENRTNDGTRLLLDLAEPATPRDHSPQGLINISLPRGNRAGRLVAMRRNVTDTNILGTIRL